MRKNMLIRLSMFVMGIATIALILTDMGLPGETAPAYNLDFVTMTPDLRPPAEQVAIITTATSTPAPQAAPAELHDGQTITHIVEPGDNLYRIAQAYDVQLEALVAINNLQDPSRVQVGQAIIVPAEGVPVEAIPTMPPQVATLAPTTAPHITATFAPPPAAINGVGLEQIVVMSPEVRQHIQSIYAQGQTLGNNPQAFSKLGDSIIENPYFLARFDDGQYNLGAYSYLQPVIEYYAGSFARQSVAVRRGLHSWSVFNPTWADKAHCLPNETVIACEFRLNRPSIIFVRLGSNDVGVPESFERNMRQIVEFSIENGVIPVLGTKADRHEGPDDTNNRIIRQIAADYHVPLWDFDLVAATMPNKGLDVDGVHLTTFYAHDYTSPTALQRGHGMHNLTALIVLDHVWQAVAQVDVPWHNAGNGVD